MNRRSLSAVLGLLFVLAAAGASMAYEVRKDDRWTPDGFIYAREMLVARGLSEAAARDEARRFYRQTPAAADPAQRGLYGSGAPPWFEAQAGLFRARVLYPRLAAAAYPAWGMRALKNVSACGIVLAAGALYVLLLLVAPPWLAACGALAAAATPLARDVGTLALTDATAFGLWAVTLTALAYYARRPSFGALAVTALSAVLLELVRPAGWLPLGAAAGYGVAAYRLRGPERRAAATMVLALFAAALAGAAFNAALHGPSLSEHLRWEYDWQRIVVPLPGESFGAWYSSTVARGAGVELASIVERGLPVFALASATAGFALRRKDPAVAPLLGVTCVAPLAILLNPADFQRALELPLVPVVAFGIVACVAVAFETAVAPGEAVRFGER
jgi:hypothetical protein